jgi:hypothetical protein
MQHRYVALGYPDTGSRAVGYGSQWVQIERARRESVHIKGIVCPFHLPYLSRAENELSENGLSLGIFQSDVYIFRYLLTS